MKNDDKKVNIIAKLRGSKVRIEWVSDQSISFTLFNGNEEWAYLRTFVGEESFNILKSQIS